jgi:hypothetical protein
MKIDTVELTFNEVVHGTTFTPIDLIVVDNIVPIRDPDTGEVTSATGGRRRVWVDWTPIQSDLKAPYLRLHASARHDLVNAGRSRKRRPHPRWQWPNACRSVTPRLRSAMPRWIGATGSVRKEPG